MILIHEGIAMITIPFIVFIFKSKNISKTMLRLYAAIIFASFLLVILILVVMQSQVQFGLV